MKYLLATIFFISAFICMAVEVFIIPGFGLMGIMGIILLAVSILYSWVQLGAQWGIGMIFLSAIIFIGGLWLTAKTKFGKRLVLTATHKGSSSSTAKEFGHLIGKKGTAISDLHPVGTAIIEGQRVEVQSKGLFIKKGCKLIVVETRGTRIIVEKASNQ